MKNFLKRFKKTTIFIFLSIIILIGYFAINILTGKAEDSGDRLHFISFKNADAIIVESNGHFGLVDAANPSVINGVNKTDNGTDVLNYAKALGVTYFDFVIMSHNHYDHIGGIPELEELFTDKTIVFYKEDKISYNSNNQIDDYEELLDNGSWKNHEVYEAAIDTFENKNSILCDVSTIGKNNGCDLTTINNGYISSLTFDANNEFMYDTNVKENIYFNFGDFQINLYNLHNLSYHMEDVNSIVTLVTHLTGEGTAVLTGDVDASIGDVSYTSNLAGKSNINTEPTGNCEECLFLGVENQVADVIGPVTLLKASNHGKDTANSHHVLDSYQPEYYITQGTFDEDSNGIYPHHKSNAAAIIFLKNSLETESYFAGQANGALVAQFSDNSTDIEIENYDNTGNLIDSSIDPIGDYFGTSGWLDIKDTNLSNKVWAYVENGHEIKSAWKTVNGNTYHFNQTGLMDTGFFVDEDSQIFYGCTSLDDCTEGTIKKGWANIDGEWYYFRETANTPTFGKVGSLVDGWQRINNKWYYFEDGMMLTGLQYVSYDDVSNYYYFSEDESDLGVMQTGWIKVDDNWYYFGEGGEAYTGWKIIDNNQYYFDSKGKMVTGLQYLTRDGFTNYYYFEEHDSSLIGVMQTGWIKINNDQYLFNSYGKAITGWYESDGNTYYFENDGKLAKGLKYLSLDDTYNYYYFNDDELSSTSNKVEYEIYNQTDLNNYLALTGNNLTGDKVFFKNTSDITFPEGSVYYLSSNSDTSISDPDVYFNITSSSKGNINFNSSTFLIGEKATLYLNATGNHITNDAKQVISNATVYGSVKNTINTDGKVTSIKGNFNADLLKASNIEFKNLAFNNAQDINDHIFDVIGCNNIIFDNISVKGYFGNYSLEELSVAYNYSKHSIYAEAIQLDVANPEATGITDLSKTDIFDNSMSDGTASSYITIKNSYFGPYNGATGEAIINKENETVIKSYGSTLGSHSYDTVNELSGYTNIVVNNNNFVNTIYMDPSVSGDSDLLKRKELYPIHMRTHVKSGYPIITVSDNTFTNQYSGYTQYGEEVWSEVGYYGRISSSDGNVVETNINVNSTVDNATTIKNKVNKAGLMKTGWVEIDGFWYYFDLTGKALTGFNMINDKTYYFRTGENNVSTGPAASAVTGLVTIDGYKYYFSTSSDSSAEGSMYKNNWKLVNNKWYHFGNDGKSNIGWYTDPSDNGTYYLCEDISNCELAAMLDGWQDIDGDRYYFRTSDNDIKPGKHGEMLTGLSTIGNKTYYFREDNNGGKIGSLFKNGTIEVNNVYYTFDGNGELVSTDEITSISLPTSALCNTVIYNGSDQELASDGEGYTVSNNYGNNVGDYTVTASLKEFYVWSDNSTTDKTFVCSVSKATPTITITNETNYLNVGDEQNIMTLSPNVNGMFTFSTLSNDIVIKTLPTNVDAGDTINLRVEALNSGSADINITFIPVSSNYKEYTSVKTILSNNNAAIIPTASSYCKENLVYNEEEQTLTKAPGAGYTFKNNKKTNAGEYNVTAKLEDGYEWSDGTTTDKAIVCSISKANAPDFTVTSYNGTYDISSHTVQVSEVEWGVIYYSLDGTSWSTDSIIRTYPGSTHVYVYVKGDNNHLDSEVKHAYINIAKAIPDVDMALVNNGNIKTDVYSEYARLTSNISGKYTISIDGNKVDNYPSEIITDSGEEKVLSLSGTTPGSTTVHITFTPDNENYDTVSNNLPLTITESDSVVDIPTSNSVCKPDLVYSGEEQKLTFDNTSAYNFSNNYGTNAGNYNVTLSLNSGYQWSDESYTNKTVTCSISKLKLDDPIINDYIGEYDGNPHAITVSNDTGKTVKYSLTGIDFNTSKPTRTDVGKTNVYVKFIGDDNHADSEVSTGSITINKTVTSVLKSNELHNVNYGFNGNILSLTANVSGIYTFSTESNNIVIKTLPTNKAANETIDLNIEANDIGTASINVTFVPNDSTNYIEFTETKNIDVVYNIATTPTSINNCINNLVYNGLEQTLTTGTVQGYQFINNKGTNAGSYTVTAKLNAGYSWDDSTTLDKEIECEISKAPANDFTVTAYSGTYDKNPHGVSVTNVSGGTIMYADRSVNPLEFSTTPITRTNVGDTNVRVYIKGDNNHLDSSYKDSSIHINSAVPDANFSLINTSIINLGNYNEFARMSSPLSGTFRFTLNDEIVDNYPSSIHANQNEEVIFSARGSVVGETTLHMVFDPDDENYTTAVSNVGLIVVNYTGNIAEIPTSNTACKANLVYSGEEQIITNSNPTSYEFINNKGTNAGDYTVTARLNDGYMWSDNTTTDKTVNCSISKANLVVPTINGYLGTYDGDTHFISASNVTGGSIRYSLDNNDWVIIPPSRVDVGTTDVYVKYIGDSNHFDSETYLAKITINKANSVISSANLVEEIEKGQTITIGPISANTDGVFTITSSDTNKLTVPVMVNAVSANEQITTSITGVNVGSASYTITFTPNSSNYKESSITKNIEVKEAPKTPVIIPTSALYCKANLKYTGSPQTITNTPLEGYTFSNNVQTSVGTYEVVASLKEGYIWSDNTLNDKTFNCTILKADSYINFDSSLVVNDGYIKSKIVPITYANLKSKIDTNGSIQYSKSDEELVTTCDDISITLDEDTTNYKLVVIGDVTKNGNAGISDVNEVFNYLRNKTELNTCQFMAADVVNDNLLFINDVAKLYQYVNNKIGGLSE